MHSEEIVDWDEPYEVRSEYIVWQEESEIVMVEV